MLITRLKGTIVFSDDYPDKLVSFVNQNVASHNIENSLMNAQALDLGEILCFVKKRFVTSPANGHNLFDVETSITMQVKQVKKMNCQVLQRFVMAYQASRPVELMKSAKHEN